MNVIRFYSKEDHNLKQQGEAFGISFKHVPIAAGDPLIALTNRYLSDDEPRKINLALSSNQQNGVSCIFEAVRTAEDLIAAEVNKSTAYLPVEGWAPFNTAAEAYIFGEFSQIIREGRVATVQTLGGTGALRLGFQLLAQEMPTSVYVSNPTWANHINVLTRTRLKIIPYPYYNYISKTIDIDRMIDFLSQAKEQAIILLQGIPHNPTGANPQDWSRILAVVKQRKLLPFFDASCHGMGTGDLNLDLSPVRMFAESGVQMLVSQSFSRSMGLQGQRIGALHIIGENKDAAQRMLSQLKLIVSALYGSPSQHGALIVQKILRNDVLYNSWQTELQTAALRIISIRAQLRSKLDKTGRDWSFLTQQKGVFSYLGLNEVQVIRLLQKYSIHMLKNSRMSFHGLNSKNVDYVANAINNILAEDDKKQQQLMKTNKNSSI